MEKSYNPNEFEGTLYQEWEKAGYFSAESSSQKPSFTIPLPPPNVTGALHIGHALVTTLEDTLTRWKRMSGYNTLWMPGTDHAGIATQMVVERELVKEKTSRHEVGREKFVARVWEWKEKHGEIINRQMKKMGASCDWGRARFTMDPGFTHAVRLVFVKLYKERLIYRGTRITSRCIRCETVLSDLEVISKERRSKLWHIRYFTPDKKHSVVIATTRPETLLGDTAVAVHPDDERYAGMHGKKLVVPLAERKVPVILDAYVDPKFGTGALKVTPAHDINDFELGKKHGLEAIGVIEFNGKLNSQAGKYQGLSVQQARDQVVVDLEALGHLVKTEEITNQVGVCQRCDTVAEPLISEQWFMNMKPMAEKAIAAARKGETLTLEEVDRHDDAFKIVPETWNATYYHWMENIRDWCVSRQLWWGHRIPAFYCGQCQYISVEMVDPTSCEKCKSKNLTQDADVLDTWFSSGLWPFVGVGWPDKTPDYQSFYPASILETGFDILFFWVARMLMLGIHFNDGKVPFHRVYLHAMVRDEKGQKMSKTKGNVVDPLDLIRDYGADAFRFSLMAMSGQGRDLRLSLDRIEGYRAFCNKLWNASRYVLMRIGNADSTDGEETRLENLDALTGGEAPEAWLLKRRAKMHVINRWMLSRCEESAGKINRALDNFRMAEASQELYALLWHDYCDWYIEFSKELLKTQATALETRVCMAFVLRQILLLGHPFIPFITEQIFKSAPRLSANESPTLMYGPFPGTAATKFQDTEATGVLEIWQDAVSHLRTFRGENDISPKVTLDVTYELNAGERKKFEAGISYICALAKLGTLAPETGNLKGKPETGEVFSKAAKFFISLKGLVDSEEEKKRLTKQREATIGGISHLEKLLAKPGFVERAPAALVEAEKLRLENLKKELVSIESSLQRLTKVG